MERETVAVTLKIPPAPDFGEPLATRAFPEVLEFLARRRSASAFTLAAPGPSDQEIADLLRLATRVPDHGKLAPWRFVILQGEAKAEIGGRLNALAQGRPNQTKALASLGKFLAPPLAIVVAAHIVTPSDIPEWEQVLSAGAVCSTLVNAASAMGYGANWITDWYSSDEAAKAIIGVHPTERVAGVIYIGTPTEPPLERVRPDVDSLTRRA